MWEHSQNARYDGRWEGNELLWWGLDTRWWRLDGARHLAICYNRVAVSLRLFRYSVLTCQCRVRFSSSVTPPSNYLMHTASASNIPIVYRVWFNLPVGLVEIGCQNFLAKLHLPRFLSLPFALGESLQNLWLWLYVAAVLELLNLKVFSWNWSRCYSIYKRRACTSARPVAQTTDILRRRRQGRWGRKRPYGSQPCTSSSARVETQTRWLWTMFVRCAELHDLEKNSFQTEWFSVVDVNLGIEQWRK